MTDQNDIEKETNAQAAVTGLKIALFMFWMIFVAMIGIALGEQAGNAKGWEVPIVAVALAPVFIAPVVRRVWRWVRGNSGNQR